MMRNSKRGLIRNPKDVAREVLRAKIADAHDHLQRVRIVLRGVPESEMDLEYGESGITQRQILDNAYIRLAELRNASTWINSCPRP